MPDSSREARAAEVEAIREGLPKQPHLCGGERTCRTCKAYAALDSLLAYIKQLEEERDGLQQDWQDHKLARMRAEQRVKELGAALRECIDWIDRPGYDEGDAAISSMARAALATPTGEET